MLYVCAIVRIGLSLWRVVEKGNTNQNAEDLSGIKGIIPKRAGKTESWVK